ncbi:hypothetical protein CS022_24745, partial [Veronia nyctiphanis]
MGVPKQPFDDFAAHFIHHHIVPSLNEEVDLCVEIISDKESPRAFDGVYPASEFSVPLADAIAEKLGLPHHGENVIKAFRNKASMRVAFEALGVTQPRVYATLKSDVDFSMIPETFPVVVKPVDSTGSTLVRICKNKEELREAANAVFERKTSRITSLALSQTALVEEAIFGPEYSAECVVEDLELLHLSVTEKHLVGC